MTFYIQALPEQMMFINNGNDVLSFYKEDSAGETVNRLSNLGQDATEFLKLTSFDGYPKMRLHVIHKYSKSFRHTGKPTPRTPNLVKDISGSMLHSLAIA